MDDIGFEFDPEPDQNDTSSYFTDDGDDDGDDDYGDDLSFLSPAATEWDTTGFAFDSDEPDFLLSEDDVTGRRGGEDEDALGFDFKRQESLALIYQPELCPHRKSKEQPCPKCIQCIHGRREYFCMECKGPGSCPHKQDAKLCRVCRPQYFCVHGRRKNYCMDCKGKYSCQHVSEKRKCKICNPGIVCVHGHHRYFCIKCKGPAICFHGITKKFCRVCKSHKFCSHGRLTHLCKHCNACIHGRVKFYCMDCNGAGTCAHTTCKKSCKICSPNKFCVHGSLKYKKCKRCEIASLAAESMTDSLPPVNVPPVNEQESTAVGNKGKNRASGVTCPHGQKKYKCRDCRSQKCHHRRRAIDCKQCGTADICQHGRRRYKCSVCGSQKRCQHGRYEKCCRDCGTLKLCQHGRVVNDCVKCGTAKICSHGRRKRNCRECKAAQSLLQLDF